MSGSRALLLALATSLVGGCGGDSPSAICVLPTKCDEYFGFSATELSNAESGCIGNQGSWSTSDRCATSSTYGSCRIPYTGDDNAFSIERIYEATMDQEMVQCASRSGQWTAN